MDKTQFLYAAAAGVIAQLALVITGHFFGVVADNLFAVGGVLIAFAAGALYGRRAPRGRPLIGAAAVGALCAFVGTLTSMLLGDVPGFIVPLGTLAAALAGLAGGALGLAVKPRRKRS